MNNWRRWAVALLLALPSAAYAQRTILGLVHDSTGRPVAGITVGLGLGPRTVSDTTGHFRLGGVPNGPTRLLILCPSDTAR